jgi:outer membrane protein
MMRTLYHRCLFAVLIFGMIACRPVFTPCARAQDAPPATRIGLQESIRRAIDHSKQVESVVLAVEQSRLRVKEAQLTRFLPKIEIENVWGVLPRRRAVKADGTPGAPGEADYITSPDTSTGFKDLRPFTNTEIKFVQPLYTFGKLSNLIDAAQYGVEAVEAKTDETEADIAHKMTQVYWGTLLVKGLFALSDDAHSKMASAEETIQIKLDEDDEDISQEDLWKVRLFQFTVNKHHEEIMKQQALLRSTYALLAGLVETESWDLDAETLQPVEFEIAPYETYLKQALEQRPELKQVRAGLGATRANVNIQKASYYPDIFLAGGLNQNWAKDRYDPDNPFLRNPTNFLRPGFVVGFKMDLNFHMTHKKVQQAEIKRLVVEEQLQAAEQGITLELRDAWLSLQEARANVEHGRKARRDGERWQNAAAQVWDAGLGETKDLIDAYKANGEMQAEYLQAVYTFNVAAAKLQQIIGHRSW